LTSFTVLAVDAAILPPPPPGDGREAGSVDAAALGLGSVYDGVRHLGVGWGSGGCDGVSGWV